MRTKTWHPNISDKTGEICVDYLKSKWNSENNVLGIVDTIFDLLEKPNFDDKLNGSCDKNGFEKIVLEYKQKYAYENQEYQWDEWNGSYNSIY